MPNRLSWILLSFIVCLSSCVGKETGHRVQKDENPLAAMGLLTRSGETVEEILLRAHAYDPKARAAAAVGYMLGIGGFPEDQDIALGWYAGTVRMPYTDQLFIAMRNALQGNSTNPLDIHELCYDAQRSFAAPLFKEAGLFDVESWCARENAPNPPYMPDQYGTYSDRTEKSYSTVRQLLAELIDRTMTAEDADSLRIYTYSDYKNFITRYIATAGKEDDMMSQKDRMRNLMRFIAQRRAEPDSGPDAFKESKLLHDFAVDALMTMKSGPNDDSVALELIRRAHAGDLAAMRHISENYRIGAMGFDRNSLLSFFWLKRGAETGDRSFVDTLPIWSYAEASAGEAWLNSHIALRYGSLAMEKDFTWIISEAEKRLMPVRLHELRQKLQKELSRRATEGFQTH